MSVETPEPPETVVSNPVLHEKVWGKMNLRDDNWMSAVVGETGSGKSYASLRIAEAVDPNFTVDQVAFSIREFMELVTDQSLGRGSVIVFEEASVEASAHDWHSKSNQVLRNVLDTWRHQNRGAIFTLPAFGQLDKGARGRMSALIQMVNINQASGYSVAKYKRCQQDSDTGKIYKKYPILDGKKYKYLKLNKPSRELREAYEERKRQYTEDLNQGLLEDLIEQQEEEEAEVVEKDPKTIADEIVENGDLDDYVADNHGQRYLDRDLIEFDFDIGDRKSRKVKAALKRHVDDDVM